MKIVDVGNFSYKGRKLTYVTALDDTFVVFKVEDTPYHLVCTFEYGTRPSQDTYIPLMLVKDAAEFKKPSALR
jgi:hypothetical protein